MATKSQFYADLGLESASNLQVDGNATITGNLTVNGTSVTVNSSITSVADSMLELANGNTSSDTLDIGFYGNYDDGLSDSGATEFTGLFRDASDSTWKLFDGLEVEPGSTVNITGTGFGLADLQVGDLTATTLTATNGLTGSSITYPTSDGTSGQVIKTNGSGTLSFGSATLDSLSDCTISSATPSSTTNPPYAGAMWIEEDTGDVYVCTNATTNNNTWVKTGSADGIVTSGSNTIIQSEDDTNVIHVNNSAEVGIGTASPASKLHLESGSAHNKLSITSTASGGTGYDAVIDLLGSASNSECAINMGINGDADREQIKTYQSDMAFRTNNTEHFRINSSGNLNISGGNQHQKGIIWWNGYDNHYLAGIRNKSHSSYNDSGGLEFITSSTSNVAESVKMWLRETGELNVGVGVIAETYTPLAKGVTSDALVVGRSATSGSLALWRSNTMEFKYYHNGMGYVMTFGSNGVISGDFNDTSDRNLKENISEITDGLTVINQLQPKNFDWKHPNKGNNQAGFIAQEVETVLPDSVVGNDYVETDGNPDNEPEGNGKSINSTAILAYAVKAIQEQQALIESQATTIADLTTRITTLEENA